jgi:hypothetical protein
MDRGIPASLSLALHLLASSSPLMQYLIEINAIYLIQYAKYFQPQYLIHHRDHYW